MSLKIRSIQGHFYFLSLRFLILMLIVSLLFMPLSDHLTKKSTKRYVFPPENFIPQCLILQSNKMKHADSIFDFQGWLLNLYQRNVTNHQNICLPFKISHRNILKK